MKNLMKRLWVEEEGQGLVEYALIIGLIAILLLTQIGWVKDGIANVFGDIKNALG